ncbi:MAG TPA: hypothetical protein VMG12_11230 [Polyangiaceae bacterium]|nr:hypothetical protein [Polyangiaceae bacterium]
MEDPVTPRRARCGRVRKLASTWGISSWIAKSLMAKWLATVRKPNLENALGGACTNGQDAGHGERAAGDRTEPTRAAISWGGRHEALGSGANGASRDAELSLLGVAGFNQATVEDDGVARLQVKV